jgi:hypothetical protein
MEAIIASLWDSGALGGIATAFVTILGQLSAMNTQKFIAILGALQAQQTSDATAHDAAFKRSGDGGVWTRRVMLFMAFAMLGICPFIFAFFQDIPVAVETLEQSGGWLWGLIPEKESFAVEYVKGFYLADVWKELMANLISAYIGAGITRKAFEIGK